MSSIKDRFQDEKNFQVREKSDLTWCQLKYNFKERVVYSWDEYECVDTVDEPAVAIKSRLSPSKTIKSIKKSVFYKKIRILEILRFLRVISLDFNARNGSIQIFDFP